MKELVKEVKEAKDQDAYVKKLLIELKKDIQDLRQNEKKIDVMEQNVEIIKDILTKRTYHVS